MTTDPTPVDFLYGTITYFSDDNEDVRRVIPFRIVRRTAKRIFYILDERDSRGRTGSVDRQALEADGVVTNRARSYYAADFQLYATREAALDSITPAPLPTIAQLRRAAVEAHPDRGGTSEGFQAAHRAYEAAKIRQAQQDAATTAGESL